MTEVVADLWDDVVGQGPAVARLRAAAASPVHAYLLVGPEGSGTREAARAFAAELLSDGLDADSAAVVRRQVAAGEHAALRVVEREGPTLRLEAEVRPVIAHAYMAPAVGSRQIIVIHDFHLAQAPSVGAILKVLEEPPSSTVFVLVGEELPAEMATISSRCVTVPFDAIADSAIVERLVSEGVDRDAAGIAAVGSGGSMTQARLLASDPHAAARRERWYAVAGRLDGTGATAAALVDEVLAASDELAAPLTDRQEIELADLAAREEMMNVRLAGERKALVDRHKREQRRVRTADLRSGLGVLVASYRDALVDGGSADDFLAAADAVQELADALVFNPNETLQLQALFVTLPPLA